MQYLYRQTGQALQDMHPDSEGTAQMLEEHYVEDNVEEDEGFADATDPTVLNLEVQAPASLPPSPSSSSHASGPPSSITTQSTSLPSRLSSEAGAVQAEDEDMVSVSVVNLRYVL